MDNDSGRRIYDVGRPSQPQPPPTSKPIIVGHRPVMPDPMLRRDYRNLHPQAPDPAMAPPPREPAQEPMMQPPEPAAPPPPEPKSGPPFAKYAPRPPAQPQPPPATDYPPPPPAQPPVGMPPEDLTLHIPAGKVSVWRSPLTWLGSALLVLAIAFLVFVALRLVGR